MKLYIWKDVLTDYTSGMIVALAPDLDTALLTAHPSLREDMKRVTPTIVDLDLLVLPQVWSVHGGG